MMVSMAPGLPYAIAARLAYPHRQSVAIVGDGGFAMLMAELTTAVAHNLPVNISLRSDRIRHQRRRGRLFEQLLPGVPNDGHEPLDERPYHEREMCS
jgi:Thiamine pyrophosphate enzyme, C-terminal TPP binding domain